MKSRCNRFLPFVFHMALGAAILQVPAAWAGTLFWDTNAATPGSGNIGGSWDSGTNWSTSANGDIATGPWTDGESAVFSAGTDGTGAKTVAITGTIATPSIQLKEVGLVTLAGGAIDITGGSTFDTSVLGLAGGRQLFWSSAIVGNGQLTLATHGSTSDTGDGSNSFMVLEGANTFTGDITITSGIVRANSNLGNLSNKVILNGGGVVDPNLNLIFPYDIQVDGGHTGVYRTWSSVSTGRASGAILGSGTLKHTDIGTLTFSGDGSAFTGTIDNARGSIILASKDWSGTRFVNSDGTSIQFNAPGTTTIGSYEGDREVFIPAGSRLDVASGSITVVPGTANNTFAFQPSGGGSLTSSSGTLTLDWDVPFTTIGTQSISVGVHDFDGITPLALVKNGPGGLTAFNQANTYSGGTTINNGRVSVQNSQALGSGKVIVASSFIDGTAGQAWLNSAGITVANSFEISGVGPTEPAGNLGAIRFDNNTAVSGNIDVTDDARIVAFGGAVGTHSGALTGDGELEINFLSNASANGTINLTGSLSGFTGDLVVPRGRLNIPSGTVGGGLSVGDAATFSGKPSFAGNVIFGDFGGSTLIVDGSTPGALHAEGDLSLNGPVSVATVGLKPGANTIMTYGGNLLGDATNLQLIGGPGAARPGTAFDTSQPGIVIFNFAAADLTWTGGEGNTWNYTAASWHNGTTSDIFYDLDLVTFGENLNASFTTNLTLDNNDLVFSAVAPGPSGEAVTIEYSDTFVANTPLGVAVVGNAITVTIGTDAGNAIVSTAAEVKAAIEAFPAAAALVSVSFAPENDGTGFVGELPATPLARRGNISIASGLAVRPTLATFDHSADVAYHLSGPGTIIAPIIKKGAGTLTIGHPTDYTQAGALVTGGSSIVIENGTLAFSSRTALATNTPVILGNENTGNAPTVLEVPRSSAQDQAVLNVALTLGTLAEGAASEAIVRYTGISNGSTTTGGAATVQGTVDLNGRALYLENTSPESGGTARLWNFQSAISGVGDVHVRTYANPDGSTNGVGRVRIQSASNNWAGDLYLDRGEVQIGAANTVGVIPDNSIAYFAAGSRLTMLNRAETIRGLVGGADTEAIPFTANIASNTGANVLVRLTLTDSSLENTHSYDGTISNGSTGTFGLTKAGAATQVLNGPCTHTGTTLVTGGTLVVNNTFTSAITVSAGATLAGTMTSSAAITATAAGARIAPGNSIGTMTASNVNLSTGGNLDIEISGSAMPGNDRLVATGTLNITNSTLNVTLTGTSPGPVVILATYGSLTGTFATTNGIPAGYALVYGYDDGNSSNNIALVGGSTDPYLAWLETYPAISGAAAAPDADFDGDGISNGMEFVLGGDPTVPGSASLIGKSVVGGNLVLTFKRTEASKAFDVFVEHGTTLATWPGQIPIPTTATAGLPVTVVDNGEAADDVTVTIPMGTDPRKFARISTNIPFDP